MSSQVAVRSADPKLPLIVGGAALIALSPSLYELFSLKWAAAPHYSFTPLFLIAVGFILFRRWQDEGRARPEISVATIVRWIPPALLLAAAIWLRRPWLSSISFVLALRAFVFTLGGVDFYKTVRLECWALWLCVPLPFNLDVALITSMQQFASRQASAILDLFGYRHLLTGVMLTFPDRAFEVEEACSGVHSLFASIAGVAVYCVLKRRSLSRSLTLLAFSVFWVVALNIARIVLVVVGEISWKLPLGEGLVHDFAGYIIFALVVLAVISTDRLLIFVLPERQVFSESKSSSYVPRIPGSAKRVAAKPFTGAAVGICAVLLIFGFVRPSATKAPLRLADADLALNADSLPNELRGWVKTNFEVINREPGDILGERSYSWTFEKNGLQSTVAVDGPFGAWHDLGYCYVGSGWKLTSAKDRELRPVTGDSFVATELRMENTDGQSGHVVFAAFGQDGRQVSPPAVRVGATGGARLQEGILGFFRPRDQPTAGPVFVVQAFSAGPLALSDEEQFDHRRLLRRAVVALGGGLESSARQGSE